MTGEDGEGDDENAGSRRARRWLRPLVVPLLLLSAAGLVMFLALVLDEPWDDAIAQGIASLIYYPAARLGLYTRQKAAEGSAAARARRIRGPADDTPANPDGAAGPSSSRSPYSTAAPDMPGRSSGIGNQEE